MGYHSFNMLEKGAQLQYYFKFDSTTFDHRDHLQLLNGVAVCEGCSHVSCAMESGPKMWESLTKPTRPGARLVYPNGPPHEPGKAGRQSVGLYDYRCVVVRHHNEESLGPK